VALGEGPRAQGRQILESELEAAPPPYVSLIPPGTMLRASTSPTAAMRSST